MNTNNLIRLARQHYVEGRLADAEHVYRKILEHQPDYAGVYYELGNVFRDKGKLDEAIVSYKKALDIDPKFPGSYNNLGNVLRIMGRLSEAIYYYRRAIVLAPNFAGSYYNLAQALHDTAQLDEAVTYYRKALQIDPNFGDADYNLGNPYYNLGNALRDTGQLEEAVASYQRALQINPNHVSACINLGNTFKDTGQLEEAVTCYRRALQIKPDFVAAYSNLLLIMNYNNRYDAQTIASEHLRFAKQIVEPLSLEAVTYTNERIPGRNLRIGYVSPDFRRHAVAHFSEPAITAHNREHFEVFCYSNSLRHDEVTTRIQGKADQWRNIAGMSDKDVARLIQEDRIDILVDLAGHTADNRILVFARKPAPIQISWIGYLATTGLSTMDYKIVDGYTDPPGKTEQFYTERLLRLPESFLCYLPFEDSPDVGPLPASSRRRITFGSFNNFAKVTTDVFAIWAKILGEVPESRLILKGKSFRDKSACRYAMDMFAQRGIASERVILQPPDPAPQHLRSYNLVDIGLDTFPFNGAATTCEAMWMGVPVITLEGIAYHSRVGTSLLSNVGLPGLVAKTHDEYVELAVSLASDIDNLKSLRGSLRDRMAHSPLTDAKRFTSNLEKCYRDIWESWCKSS